MDVLLPAWVLGNLPVVLAQQPSVRNFDAAGLRAFEVDSMDVDAIRQLTGWYLTRRYPDPAGRFADRLLALSPGDSIGLAAAAVHDSAMAARSKARIRDDWSFRRRGRLLAPSAHVPPTLHPALGRG